MIDLYRGHSASRVVCRLTGRPVKKSPLASLSLQNGELPASRRIQMQQPYNHHQGDSPAESIPARPLANENRTSHFARIRGRIRCGRLQQPSFDETRSSRRGLLGTQSRGASSPDVSYLRSAGRMAASATRRLVSRSFERVSREGESANGHPSADYAETHPFGTAPARWVPPEQAALRAGFGAQAGRDTRVASSQSEPSSSATQPQCPTDAWHNASSSSRSGDPVSDKRSTRAPLVSEGEEDPVDLGMRLDALEIGCLFAGRYRIQPDTLDDSPHGRYAVERSTGRSVFLKFFPGRQQEFENATKAHRALQNGSKFVCRMLDSVESIHGFPPCVVLERGRYTLADRMTDRRMSSVEQRAVLYSVLEALEYSHSQGFVHGGLDPTHVMWFADDLSWKLVNLSGALPTGESTVQPNACRYTCPETTQSLEKGHGGICAKPSMDMWSFGLLAFEVLTSSHVADAVGIPDLIERQLEQKPVCGERTVKRWLSANRRGRIDDALHQQSFRFVRSLLQRDPEKRRTATEALEDVLFRSATDVYQRADAMDELASEHLPPDLDPQPSTLSMLRAVHRHLEIQQFADDSDPWLPFYDRRTEEPLSFFDDRLPHEPVYVLRLAESLRLRMRLSYDTQLRLPVEGIASVALKAPDAEEQLLDFFQRIENGSVTALISFDPKRILSPTLNSVSPCFGPTDRTYVKISVRTKVRIAGRSPRELDFDDCLYCKVVHRHNQLRWHKYLGVFVTKDERLRRQSGRMESP